MIEAPARDEAARDDFRFMDRVRDGNVVLGLRAHLDTAAVLFSGISEEKS